jgi:hypothetical protein
MAPRDRLSGAGLKPARAAAVKSRGDPRLEIRDRRSATDEITSEIRDEIREIRDEIRDRRRSATDEITSGRDAKHE